MEHYLICEAIGFIKLAKSLGGDADTLAAISCPMPMPFTRRCQTALSLKLLRNSLIGWWMSARGLMNA